MTLNLSTTGAKPVSLFTREWIEIKTSVFRTYLFKMSPSLRGSGLKSYSAAV